MYEDKAKEVERKLLQGLNEEQSWAARHPGWMTIITLTAFLVAVMAILRSCH